MLNWIGKALGGARSDVPAGVPAAWVKKLEQQLAPLDKQKGSQSRAGLSRDIVSYVLHGTPLSVIQDVGKHSAVSDLFFTGYGVALHERGRTRDSLYAEFDQVPTDVALRWAQVLDASVDQSNRGHVFCLQLPPNLQWLEALLLHASGTSPRTWTSDRPKGDLLSTAGIERLLEAEGADQATLLKAAFTTPVGGVWGVDRRTLLVTDLVGYSDAVARHRDVIRPLLLPSAVSQRLQVLTLLAPVALEVLDGFAPQLAELAVSGSKQVRAAVEPILRSRGAAFVAPLKAFAVEGKPEQRTNALRQLWFLAGHANDDGLRAFARDTALADKAPSVQALPEEWETGEAQAVADVGRYEYDLPVVDWSNALTPAVDALLGELWREMALSVQKHNKQMREHAERMKAQGQRFQYQEHPGYDASSLTILRDYIASPNATGKQARQEHRHASWQHVTHALNKLASHDAMSPSVLLKILAYFGLLVDKDQKLTHVAGAPINVLHRASGRPSLLEFSLMLDAMGYPGRDAVFSSFCASWGNAVGKEWQDEAIWPFFAHHVERLVQLLNPAQTKDYWFDRKALYRAVASLPTPPATIVSALFDLALGTGKSDREPAQLALANLPGKEVRIIGALADGKADVRAIAAQWLGRLRHVPAIPALEKAVAKEKHDVAKGAMLDALQALDQPVEKYLDRSSLAAEAGKSLAKGMPKDLEWFPWASLPVVRWQDSGEPVAADVVRWMLVQAVKQKSAEPNAVLRKYCAMFAPREREALGQFILEAWLAEDVRPIPPEEALQRAVSQATSTHGYMKSHPQYYKDDPHFGKSVEELTAAYLPGFLRQPAGSAIGSKGLLAVAAACAGERAAAPVARFLKEYYGTRAAQGKALIAMLAWIEHPGATQLMLSVGNRFRTKSFQEEATRQAEALAERKGWTLAELADRTMPSAGFDETGTLELSYGNRAFTARLLPDFKVELFNPDGKKIAALPEPRQDDDADRAKDAKKAFSLAKKEIKNIVDLQTSRLYEALCTGRDWSYDDWEGYLNRHPVVRRLVQRLVWNASLDGTPVATFRPMDDGTLTDSTDSPVVLAGGTRVQIAHDSNLSPELVQAWQQHLLDYEVVPLFQQFGKGTYALPAGKGADTTIDAFEGHLIEAYALRNRALKLGYTRGAAEDGGWFMTYEKRFPTLGMLALIEFTGNPLPEQNRTVALINLSFSNSQGEAWQRGAIALAKVPTVLLSECYNDLRLIASDGSGFDPEWRKKSEY